MQGALQYTRIVESEHESLEFVNLLLLLASEDSIQNVINHHSRICDIMDNQLGRVMLLEDDLVDIPETNDLQTELRRRICRIRLDMGITCLKGHESAKDLCVTMMHQLWKSWNAVALTIQMSDSNGIHGATEELTETFIQSYNRAIHVTLLMLLPRISGLPKGISRYLCKALHFP